MTDHPCYGDTLTALRDRIATESVQLITLDPPFNSNAGYNVLFKAPGGSGSDGRSTYPKAMPSVGPSTNIWP